MVVVSLVNNDNKEKVAERRNQKNHIWLYIIGESTLMFNIRIQLLFIDASSGAVADHKIEIEYKLWAMVVCAEVKNLEIMKDFRSARWDIFMVACWDEWRQDWKSSRLNSMEFWMDFMVMKNFKNDNFQDCRRLEWTSLYSNNNIYCECNDLQFQWVPLIIIITNI